MLGHNNSQNCYRKQELLLFARIRKHAVQDKLRVTILNDAIIMVDFFTAHEHTCTYYHIGINDISN